MDLIPSPPPSQKRRRDSDDDRDALGPAKRKLVAAPDDTPDSAHQILNALVFDTLRTTQHNFEDLADVRNIHEFRRLAAEALRVTIAGAQDSIDPDRSWLVSRKADDQQKLDLLDDALAAAPGLDDALLEALRSKDFKAIRTAEFLRLPRPSKQPKAPRKLSDSAVSERAVRDAWKTAYSGESHVLLHKTLIDMRRNGDNAGYSNTASIVQSSGCGKSRMVHEAAGLVFTFPFNLRALIETDGLAYPPPDGVVRDYMCSATLDSLSEDRIRVHYHLFLKNLFHIAQSSVSKLFQQSLPTTAMLAAKWREHLEGTTRKDLYQQVIAGAKRDYSEAATVEATKMSAKAELSNLVELLRSKVGDQSASGIIDVLLYFDEAHSLTSGPEGPWLLYDILRSVFRDYVDTPLFALFISTSARIAQFAPPQGVTNGLRMIKSNAHHAPITETPFDCDPDILVEQDLYNRQDVAELRFMARFGRPLYWSWLRQITKDEEVPAFAQFILAIQAKLVDKKNPSVDAVTFAACGPMARLAVADVRLCLAYEPHAFANNETSVPTELIARYMRVAYSVPKHREYVRSGYPSEPVLAEAAACQLNAWRVNNPSALLEILDEHMTSGLLDRGELGEVVARLLITEAYDRAITEKDPSPRADGVHFSAGCYITAWVEQLFQPDTAQKILSGLAANGDGQTFAKAFEHATIRFTHFVRAGDDHVLDTQAMAAAYTRGMAFICRAGQGAVDFVIPVLLNNTTIGSSKTSGILVQVKRRLTAGKYLLDADAFEFFHPERDPTASDNRPWISLVMDLDVRPKLPAHAKTAAIGILQQNRPKASPVSQPTFSSPSTHESVTLPSPASRIGRNAKRPSYWIYVPGCSNTTYRIINPADQDKYTKLLCLGDLFLEHARPSAIPSLRRMKPFFEAGKSSYHWFDSQILSPPSTRRPSEEEMEGVLVGAEAMQASVNRLEAGVATDDEQ